MFKTMNGVEVYDKSDVDSLVTPIQQNAAEAKQIATAINSRKLDKTEATLEFEADRTRLLNLENSKVNKSEAQQIVTQAIDATINAKIAAITSDINHIVDNAIDDALEDYDTPAQTAQKTATAIDTALGDYDDSNTVDSKITAAIATRLVAMTTTEATAIVDQYF